MLEMSASQSANVAGSNPASLPLGYNSFISFFRQSKKRRQKIDVSSFSETCARANLFLLALG